MKKVFKLGILAAALVMIAATSANAQKNSKFVSGTVSYTKSTDVKASYSFNPTIGYFVTEKVAVGVLGEIGETATGKTTNVGVFGRCHFMTIGKNCHVFSQLSLTSNSATEAGVKTTSTEANLGLGANYSISKRLGLTMNVCDLVSYETADGNSTMTVGFTGVTNPFATAKFGVIYNF
jgi:outer membrane protein